MTSIARILMSLMICTAINGCKKSSAIQPLAETSPSRQDRDHPAAEQRLPDPIGHLVNVHEKPWNSELAPDASIVEAAAPPESKRIKQASRPGREAFVVNDDDVSDPKKDSQCDFVYFTRERRCFRIEGIPLPYRPLDSLAWASERYLIFDRWSQPHYGLHYVVDTQELRVVHVTPFPDQFYLDQQSDSVSPRTSTGDSKKVAKPDGYE